MSIVDEALQVIEDRKAEKLLNETIKLLGVIENQKKLVTSSQERLADLQRLLTHFAEGRVSVELTTNGKFAVKSPEYISY